MMLDERTEFRFGEVAEWSKALDWNSSNIFTGVPGFESLPLRQTMKALIEGLLFGQRQAVRTGSTKRQDSRFAQLRCPKGEA